jgi:predicted dehydrogenase
MVDVRRQGARPGPVRIGVVGLDHWYWAFSFAGAVAEHADAVIVSVMDAEPDRAELFARRYGIKRTVASIDDVIEDRAVDLIASFVSVDQNPAVCIAAAGAGKHVLSVKPLARTLGDASCIREAVRAHRIHFIPAEATWLLSDQNLQLREWIAEGRLGEILTASFSLWSSLPRSWPNEGERVVSWPQIPGADQGISWSEADPLATGQTGNSAPGWYVDPQRAPGGAWIDHSVYQIALLRWLLDDEVREVSGHTRRLKYHDLPVEDYGHATLQLRRGAFATIENTWTAPPGAFRFTMSLTGTNGAVSYDSITGRLALAGAFPPFTAWVQAAPRGFYSTGLDHLVAVVRNREQPVATVEDAWQTLAVCCAFYEAAQSGRPVVL